MSYVHLGSVHARSHDHFDPDMRHCIQLAIIFFCIPMGTGAAKDMKMGSLANAKRYGAENYHPLPLVMYFALFRIELSLS